MPFLYHLVPKIMHGTILYPLNELREKFPQIYNEEIRKYKGRERLLTQIIPHLNCLWNDVLHFSAVNPEEIHTALKAAGGNPRPFTVFEIPTEELPGEKTIVYLYKHKTPDKKLVPENFIPFHVKDMENYTTLPEETENYYRETFAQGERPLLFHRIPHILYQGSLDTIRYSKKTY